MRSYFGLLVAIVAVIGVVESISWDRAIPTSAPVTITQAPISLDVVLLTAFPESLREIAATNIPAVSQILWSEFLDGSKPAWFTALPTDIQSYLVKQYGPSTASASTTPSSSFPSSTATPTHLLTSQPTWTEPTTSPSPSATHHSGLSAGDKIGIAVGVPLVTLGLAAFLVACYLLRHRRRQHTRASRPPTPGFIPTTTRHGHSTSSTNDTAMESHHPLRGGAEATLFDGHFGWNSGSLGHHSGVGGVGGPSYEHIPPPLKPLPYRSSNRSRVSGSSFTSLHSVPEAPEHETTHRIGVIPVAPPRSPRRPSLCDPAPLLPVGMRSQGRRRSNGGAAGPVNPLSPLNPAFGMGIFEEAHAGYAEQHAHQLLPRHKGQGIFAGERDPYRNEHSYEEDYAPETPYGGGWEGHDRDHGYYTHQAAGKRTELYTPANEWPLRNEHRARDGKSPLWDRVYDGV
ncbi:hypothetical protein K432DRAFT_395565 [Lepidopterella palustris CBS 459.81]|uniref:Transmembrane protein n=1 Tax=Lepidopterella palustris CBS 459.81 TaxID=1314670 RepID=A0A8E2JCL4_9PEZI|nr:hypothetical protein K432DRAFT_395565 [Lepidopterella palustris CBS 459.81]